MCTMSPFVLPICHVMSLGSYESNLLTNSQRLSLFLYPQRVTLCPFPIVHTLNLCPGQLKNTNAIQCSFFLCLYRQCDQIGRFLKVLGDMVSSKSSPNRYMVYFWAKAKSSIFNVKLLWLICGQLLEKFGLLFNLSSGHAVCMTHTQA